MARKFGPFDNSVFYEVENRRLQRALASGSILGFAGELGNQGMVTAGTGAQLIIGAFPNGALVDGMYVENPTTETVTVTTNTGSTNPRIDRLVMRLDMSAKTIAPFQIVGTPAASPQAPALTQTDTVYDMPLCRYQFPGSATAQNPSSIVDERPFLKFGTKATGRLGVVARLSEAGPTSAGAGWQTVSGLSITFTIPSRRSIRMTFDLSATSNVAGTSVGAGILNTTNNIRKGKTSTISTANFGESMTVVEEQALDAGTYTIVAQQAQFGGSGGAFFTADKQLLIVDDLGPA